MRKKLLSILLTFCMALTLLPTAAFAEGNTEEPPACTCESACTTENMNANCTICGAEGAPAENCAKYVKPADDVPTQPKGEAVTLNGTATEVYSAKELTDAVNAGSNIKMMNDIEIHGNLEIKRTVTLDLNNHTLKATKIEIGKQSTSVVTFTATGGEIDAWVNNTSTGVIKGGTFLGTVTNSHVISGGTFRGKVGNCNLDGVGTSVKLQEAQITGGDFYDEVTNGPVNEGNFSSTIIGGNFYGKVSNTGFSIITGGTFNGEVANNKNGTITGGTFTGKVTGSGTISGATVIASVSNSDKNYPAEKQFLAALEDPNVTTIQLKSSNITVERTETLTIDRPITLVNGSGNSGCTLSVYSPLTIAEGGALTLDDGTYLYPFSSVTVNGSLTVGENSGIIFEWVGTFLKVSQGATLTTQPAGNDTIAGLLSLGEGVTLTVEGTLNNNGTLSVSNMENLKKAADIGGDLTLLNMTITEDYTLDMKGKWLSISSFLKFLDNANLTVRNASKVDATGDTLTISGGSYYCPVYAGDSEYGITGGSFYGPVTVKKQGSGTSPTPIFGGAFYGGIQGCYEIKGGTFYNGSFQQGFSLPETTRIEVGKKIVTYKNGEDVYAMQVVSDRATAPDTPVKSGYTFAGWYTEAGEMFDFKKTNVTKNITLTAKWTRNSSSRTYYTIQATAGTGGAISPSGKVSVREGRNQVFTITPDQGYAVSNVQIDGESVGAVTSYSFENVRKAHTIAVSFAKVKAFVDVPAGSYYEDAVNWAVENGITQGTDDTHFSPDDVCTRAQMVTFLWRAAGSPKVENGKNPFTDVQADAYYYDAVLWAVEKGVTSGTSATTFSPDATVTRGQTVTFLYRNAGSPEVSGTMPFTDVEADAYYAKAVQWAVQQKITTGTSETTFSPMSDCTRGQIVTFLYRAK